MMTRTEVCGAFALLALVAGCHGATPQPAQTARAEARAAVVLVATAYQTVGQACLDDANATGSVTVAKQCLTVLEPARDLIMGAAAAVDTEWSNKAACALAQAAILVATAAPAVKLDETEQALVADAKSLATAAMGAAACASDAGADR